MSEQVIAQALIDRLQALALSPVLPIAYPNRTFEPPEDDKFLRCHILHGETFAYSIEGTGSNRHYGVFQIDVNWRENEGVMKPLAVADQIIAQFRRATKITSNDVCIQITQSPYVGPLMHDDGRAKVPVSVPYTAFSPNA